MNKLTVYGNLLKRNGYKQTLALAEAHNLRKIPAEVKTFHHIDPEESHLNKELVPLGQETLESKVLRLVTEAGIDPNKGVNKRFDKGYAIEWMFTTTHGFQCDFELLYIECLNWLRLRHPTCPIAHAVIHYDENTPHLHVIMVPIKGSRLPTSNVLGYKGVCRKRNEDLFSFLGHKYGFTSSQHLKGNAKRIASQKAIEACKELASHDFRESIWQPLMQAINSRPEPFLHALNIPISQVLKDAGSS
jgi:hypothetical protein